MTPSNPFKMVTVILYALSMIILQLTCCHITSNLCNTCDWAMSQTILYLKFITFPKQLLFSVKSAFVIHRQPRFEHTVILADGEKGVLKLVYCYNYKNTKDISIYLIKLNVFYSLVSTGYLYIKLKIAVSRRCTRGTSTTFSKRVVVVG